MRFSAGIEVAKQTHWVCVMDEAARVVLDRAVENDQAALDVTSSIVTFLEAVLLAEGLRLIHVPGIAVNRAGQGFAGGERKSDPRDTRTSADLARIRPELRAVALGDETTVAIRLKMSRRRDLVQDQTRRLSRLRQLLGSIHPGLERALDVTCLGPLALIARHVAPGEIRAAGRRRIVAHPIDTPHLRDAEALADRALAAAQTQTTVVLGEAVTAEMVRELAREALDDRTHIARPDRELEGLLDRHPDGALIRNLPGMGAILAAEFDVAAGDAARFRSPNAMAAAAGLAPVLRQSGRSRAVRRAFSGDKALKRVLVLSAFCAVMIRDPLSRAFYDRKRSAGKHHTQALVAVARRRVTVLWTMLRRRKIFERTRYAA
jgi:transposase